MTEFSRKHYQLLRNSMKPIDRNLVRDVRYTSQIMHICDVAQMVEKYNDGWIGINVSTEYLGVTKETVRNWIKKTKWHPSTIDRKALEI